MKNTELHKPNKLINELSPYLLQHAYNPVEWYPWSDEVFAKAKKENKPIFLSIGYSTCHWCHVMEHESFEDKEVAELMNEKFISIKVDREERPDIDNVYMTVCQMMTGSGGWPLTVIMTPDKKPFFAGTYFPKYSNAGRIGMMDLLLQLEEVWKHKTKEALDSAEQITKLLNQISQEEYKTKLDESVIHKAYTQLHERFDNENGGFGSAPKFPSPHNFLFLLRFWRRTKNTKALDMVEQSLKSMRCGGIYDQIGYGFHRYSTDSRWLVPHFEKMLYDQAMLSMAYVETYQVTKNDFYKDVAKEIFSYVLRDMISPEGGFYSAEDADSEGEEGKFYVWNYEEMKHVLNKEELDLMSNVFNMKEDGNNIFYLNPDFVEKFKLSEDRVKSIFETTRRKLFAVRKKRVHPYKDDKILTSWNGLMIVALSKGAQVFGESLYSDAARRAADFILSSMFNGNKLLHCFRNGKARINGHIDDYAFFVWGLLELYEATFEEKYLRAAIDLNKILLEHFWDNKNGGFYFTADYDKDLIARQKEIYDGALPSGNSVAMLNLLHISDITCNMSLREKAIELSSSFSKNIEYMPVAHTQFLVALDYLIGPSCQIILAGNLKSEDSVSLIQTVRGEFVPNKIVLFKDTEKTTDLSLVAEYIRNYNTFEGKTAAYICKNHACKLPVIDVKKVKEQLFSM